MSVDLRLRAQRALRGKYRIDREIGRGETAVVYSATIAEANTVVVIKLLLPSAHSPAVANRFAREMALAQSLTHEHIIPVLDTGQADGLSYYVMPFFPDGSLRDRLNGGAGLAIVVAAHLAAQVAGALAYAHERGVMHRDIKPENVLLSGDRAALGDFGVSKAFVGSGHESLTSTGFIVGTPTYMSPEQAANEGDLDGRSDVYSLGVMLHEMVAGQAPFNGATTQQIIAARFLAPPAMLDTVRPDVPRDLAALGREMLSLEPNDRPSARDVATRLQTLAPAP